VAQSPRFRVPEEHGEPLEALGKLSDEAFERLVQSLRSEPPALDADELAARIRDAVPELAQHADDVVEVILIVDLLRESRGASPEEMAEWLRDAQGMPGTAEDRSILARRLAQSLSAPAILVTAKAVDLLLANERNFNSARIVTELRPVFGEDVSKEPAAAVLVHRLELDYFRASGRRDTFHVGLDEGDLEILGAAVARAQAKAKTMISFADRSGLRLANPRSSSES
jgi:hypothetical protein